MNTPQRYILLALTALHSVVSLAAAQDVGAIRGITYDRDFDVPLPMVEVLLVELDKKVTGSDQGNYIFPEVESGTYTLVFSKDGYVSEVRSNIVVSAGRPTDVDAALSGDFAEMDEFIVQELKLDGSTELGLLELRLQSPALLDSISSALMSKSGASDAASALKLVSGATVQDGKYAVIRGLPDRYVNSQLSGVRLPTADETRRAVQLDQYPSAVIESIRVSKTFTPDQQGDASGGAVNVVLKGIPDEAVFSFGAQYTYNTQASFNDDFLTWPGAGLDFWGNPTQSTQILTEDFQYDNPSTGLIEVINGLVNTPYGATRGPSPIDYKFNLALGGKHELEDGLTVGGFASFFHENDSAYFDDGIDDSWVVFQQPGGNSTMTPETSGDVGDRTTSLYDVTQGTETVQWGTMLTGGVEWEGQQITGSYLRTVVADNQATLLEDTRGKEYFYPGYDWTDPNGGPSTPPGSNPGNAPDNINDAPYTRLTTLTYEKRTTESYILQGSHSLPFEGPVIGDYVSFLEPIFDWTLSTSTASLSQPGKSSFASKYVPRYWDPGNPVFGIPGEYEDSYYDVFKPAQNFAVGNLTRIWKNIDETSDQYQINATLPFEQWDGEEGFFKFGYFNDMVERTYRQETFANYNYNGESANGLTWDDSWAAEYPSVGPGGVLLDRPLTQAFDIDVDYDGQQSIDAMYWMFDLPLSTDLNLIGGARFENTSISIVNYPGADAYWYPPDISPPVETVLRPGDGDVDYNARHLLPSIALAWEPTDEILVRGAFSQTIARQTFRELSPIIQQDYLGGPIFVGNPDLIEARLKNYDLRFDYTPYPGGLVSVSGFYKQVSDSIEVVQRFSTFDYTSVDNFPDGTLSGIEFEMRQDLGQLLDYEDGLSIGMNATLIDSEVQLPADQAARFSSPAINKPTSSRPMTNAPEYLLNLYGTWEIASTGTEFSIFYTHKGKTLIAGAAVKAGTYIPDVYAVPIGTLNLSVVQKIGEHFKVKFAAKNLTNPDIKTVYESDYVIGQVTRTSFTKGIDFSISVGASFDF